MKSGNDKMLLSVENCDFSRGITLLNSALMDSQ